jgi:hypothetical protein
LYIYLLAILGSYYVATLASIVIGVIKRSGVRVEGFAHSFFVRPNCALRPSCIDVNWSFIVMRASFAVTRCRRTGNCQAAPSSSYIRFTYSSSDSQIVAQMYAYRFVTAHPEQGTNALRFGKAKLHQIVLRYCSLSLFICL